MSVSQIRSQFNALGYAAMADAGNLRTLLKRNDPVSLEKCEAMGFPKETRSQIVVYFQGLTRVALVHLYRKPDGTLGGLGLPDPKELLVDGCIWIPAIAQTTT